MDVAKLTQMLSSIPELCREASKPVCDLLEKIETEKLSTSKGLSFLEMKNHLLLEYVINLTQVIFRKCQGQSIENSEPVDRLVEIRTYLERIQPIEHRLKYQIDKLVKTANTGYINKNDPLLLRANPGNFVAGTSNITGPDDGVGEDLDEKSAVDSRREKGTKSGKYRPPRLAAVHYHEDGGGLQENKLLEKAKKRLRSSSLMHEIRQEYYDEPEEVVDTRHSQGHVLPQSYRVKADKERRERTQYEEDMMTRLSMTKKQRQAEKKQQSSTSILNNLTKFGGHSSALTAETVDSLVGPGALAKRRKLGDKKKSKAKSKKSKKFKRRK